MAQSFIPFDQQQQLRQRPGAIDPAAGFRQAQQLRPPGPPQGGPQGWANQMAQRMGAGDALYGQQQKQLMAAAQPPAPPQPPPDPGIMAGFGIQQPPQRQSLQAAPGPQPGMGGSRFGLAQPGGMNPMWGQKNRFIGF